MAEMVHSWITYLYNTSSLTLMYLSIINVFAVTDWGCYILVSKIVPRVATETSKSNSRTFQDFFRSFSRTFPGLFKFFFYRSLNSVLTTVLWCIYFFVLKIEKKIWCNAFAFLVLTTSQMQQNQKFVMRGLCFWVEGRAPGDQKPLETIALEDFAISLQ